MIYDLMYDIGSQIEEHSFVNGDYKADSNAKARYYVGKHRDAFEREEAIANKEIGKEDFRKWLQ
ncbi:MAG: hypothetical protein NC318_07915 [Blautia sp.]|nr:hypothetical protein [Blautia sp.]